MCTCIDASDNMIKKINAQWKTLSEVTPEEIGSVKTYSTPARTKEDLDSSD